MKKNNKTLPTVAMVTVAMAALLASSAIAPYSGNDLSAKKYSGDSNAQNSAANNDCPTELISLIIRIQQQASANCLNNINSIQDSDGAAISSTPFNAAPNQAIDVEIGERTPVPPVPPVDVGCPTETVWDVTLLEDVNDELPAETIICLFGDEPGRQDANVAGQEGIFTAAPEPLPEGGDCPFPGYPTFPAQHTSGTAPEPPFEQGGILCIGFPDEG
jgi:hypothetical protein